MSRDQVVMGAGEAAQNTAAVVVASPEREDTLDGSSAMDSRAFCPTVTQTRDNNDPPRSRQDLSCAIPVPQQVGWGNHSTKWFNTMHWIKGNDAYTAMHNFCQSRLNGCN